MRIESGHRNIGNIGHIPGQPFVSQMNGVEHIFFGNKGFDLFQGDMGGNKHNSYRVASHHECGLL